MRAEIVSIGTELLLGTITDTNASYLARRLSALGIDCFYVSQVGDNLGRLVETFGRAWERSDLVIATGGLGPTQDDLTREAISQLLGETMLVDPWLEANLRAFFERRGVQMPERNLKQATLLPSAEALPNPVGTAPGWWVSRQGADGVRTIVAMPGVPFEMKRMWEHQAEPRLRAHSRSVIVSRTLKTLGLGESAVEAKVQNLMAGSNPTLAPYAKQDGIHLRITAKAEDARQAEALIGPLEAQVRERLGEAIYGTDDDTPQGAVRRLLEENDYRCSLLEVGQAAIGAISPLLGEAGGGLAESGVGAIAVLSLAQLHRLLGRAEVPTSLEDAARDLQSLTGADVALAVGVETAPIGEADGPVAVDAEIVLLTPEPGQDTHVTRLRQSWRTQPSEVTRLVGLAGYNLLRLRLLKVRNRETS